MNAKLLRTLLTFAEDNPKRIDLTTFGEHRPSGIVADIAGWTLLLDDPPWTLGEDNTFRSPDGAREISGWEAIEAEAVRALGLTGDELWGGGDIAPLFSITRADEALSRLLELTEEAEAVIVNG